jgi:hypothetical protein
MHLFNFLAGDYETKRAEWKARDFRSAKVAIKTRTAARTE